jgi:hypothetical protein
VRVGSEGSELGGGMVIISVTISAYIQKSIPFIVTCSVPSMCEILSSSW